MRAHVLKDSHFSSADSVKQMPPSPYFRQIVENMPVREQRYRYHYSHHDAPDLRVASMFISSSGLRPKPQGFNLSTLQCNLNATWSARPVSARRVMLEANRGTRPVQARSIQASPHLPCVTLIRCCILDLIYFKKLLVKLLFV